jgi:hypothetical protein
MLKTVSHNNSSGNKTNISRHKIILEPNSEVINDSYYEISVQEMVKQYEKALYNYNALVVSSGGM